MPSIWDNEEYKPYQTMLTDKATAIQTFVDWYTGDIYTSKNVRQTAEFDATVKALFHPLARTVDLHSAFLPGFPAYDFTRQKADKAGVVLSEGTDPKDVANIQRLLRWSRWSEYGPLHNTNMALRGSGIITLTDRSLIDPTKPVVLEVRDPGNTLLVYPDKWSTWPSLMITVVDDFQPLGAETPGEFAVIITPEEVITLFEGEPYSYTDPITGLDVYVGQAPNAFKIVPAVESKFRDIGTGELQNAFSTVIPLIATVNRMATYIMGVMGQYFRPQTFIAGAERGDEDIEWGDGIMYAPADAKAQMLLAELDINGATAFVQTVHKEIKSNLPELIFDEIRGINRISTEGLELQFAELISKLTVSRAATDRGLNDMFRLGLWAAQEGGIDGFDGYEPPDSDTYDERIIELDPMRGYVPLGESALLAVEKQRIDVEMEKLKLKQLEEEGALRLEQMQQAISLAGSSPPPTTNSSASNNTAKPNPKGSGPDASSPGPKIKGNDGQPVER